MEEYTSIIAYPIATNVSNLRLVTYLNCWSQSAMESAEDPNGDLRKLIYSLVERFDALKEGVKHLKEEKSASTSTRARAS